MGRQVGDPTVVSSSIALLQERFKQLQKVREKRQGKDLLKQFSESECVAPTTPHEPNRCSLQPKVIHHFRAPSDQDSHSLRLNSQSRHADLRVWPNSAATSANTSRNFQNSDVDTSLHL
ncbi:hypothetical protein SLE2022_119380 [Rubroshorea leprosula]